MTAGWSGDGAGGEMAEPESQREKRDERESEERNGMEWNERRGSGGKKE